MFCNTLVLGIILIKGIHALTAENVTQFIGEDVFLPCPAAENILPVVTSIVEWLNVTDSDSSVIVNSQSMDMGKYFIEIHNEYKLRVQEVTLLDSGTYGCKVYGDLEVDNITSTLSNTTHVRLLVQDPEPPTKPQEVANLVTPNEIQVMWGPGNGLDVLRGFIVEIRRADNSVWRNLTNQRQGPTAIMAKATDLEPYTEYLFRVTALFNGYSKVSPVSDPIRTKPGKPLAVADVVEAHAIDATSANFTWLAPDDDIRGVLVGFRVQYIYFEGSNMVLATKDVSYNNTSLQQKTVVDNLRPATDYNISVAVKNNADESIAFGAYSSALSIRTFESLPGPPSKVQVIYYTDTSIVCAVLSVPNPNGIILKYELYYRKKGDGIWIPKVDDKMIFTIENLETFQEYELTAAARNSVGLGPRGEVLDTKTDTGPASQPQNVKVEVFRNFFLVTWDRPSIFYVNYTLYKVELKRVDISTNGTFMSMVSTEFYEHAIDQDMSAEETYSVTIIPVTESTYNANTYDGEQSTPEVFTVTKPIATQNPKPTMMTTTITGQLDRNSSDGNVGLAVGLIFVFLFIIVIIVVLGIYYMHRIRRNDPSDPHKPGNGPRITSVFDEPVDGCIVDLLGKRKEDPEEPPIPIEKFEEHVIRNHANSDSGFAEEFEEIQLCVKNDYPAAASADPACKPKNRYTNIVAYDHSRVKLQVIGDKPCSDYINGNYIDGFNKKNAFIATQGPLKSTVEDFWRMIWEQNSYTIIMITNLMEKGRRKCDKYWPIEGSSEKYGDFEVTCEMEDEMASFTVRNFVVKNTKMKKTKNNERAIIQYHYTDWPDHGVPNYTLPVYTFIKKSVKANPADAGPMIVHCSAGVGRTGTYITIESMLRQIKAKKTVNVCSFLKKIRGQRNHMVQTEEQYCFIHDVLRDSLRLEHSEVPIKGIREYIEKIRVPSEGTKRSILDQHFELLHTHKFKDYDFLKAHKEINQKKNRRPDILPVERSRVHMSSKAGEEGSDYVNATYVPGYRKINEFIVTQFPLENTISDFWRMIWDTNSPTIVMISSKDDQVKEKFYERVWDEDPEVAKMEKRLRDMVDDEDGEGASVTTPLNSTSTPCTGVNNLHVPLDEACLPQDSPLDPLQALDEPVYWPTSKDNPMVFGNFKVSFVEEEHHLGFMTREFVLESTQDEYELDVKQYRCTYWPESCSPLHTAFDLIKAVQDRSMNNDGPITVHDKYGSTNAGTFCALSALYQQMNNEDTIDIYQIAKLYTFRRKGMFTDKRDYFFLYRAMQSIYAAEQNVRTLSLHNQNSVDEKHRWALFGSHKDSSVKRVSSVRMSRSDSNSSRLRSHTITGNRNSRSSKGTKKALDRRRRTQQSFDAADLDKDPGSIPGEFYELGNIRSKKKSTMKESQSTPSSPAFENPDGFKIRDKSHIGGKERPKSDYITDNIKFKKDNEKINGETAIPKTGNGRIRPQSEAFNNTNNTLVEETENETSELNTSKNEDDTPVEEKPVSAPANDVCIPMEDISGSVDEISPLKPLMVNGIDNDVHL
ncbi:putative receptor-type tyrosine-protein phosphatase mosPTP-1 isoform X2 [Antedon mediterranea]|uniref:putative receptor-type tyrosine-protein phosphatase mosPTP-1 isoform X2 n=1 Tax=Antedon mediterranea TaxID=105859 RepID=UPI003AF829F7